MNLSDVPPICVSVDAITQVQCMLPEGHDGLHDAVVPAVRWLDDECPAGGPHRYEFLTTWDMGPGRPEPSGFYCQECHTPAPERDDL